MHPDIYRKGGIPLRDDAQTAKLRGAGWEVIKAVGKKIYKADFNLGSISFPIKCMDPYSILQALPLQHKVNWLYLNYAAARDDPVERFKAFLTSNIAFLRTGRSFLKPLNPKLGETYQGRGPDGTKIFAE